MKWVIVSDNHGMEHILTDIKVIHEDADYFIHLGDSEFSPENLELKDYITVKGNCDYNGFDNERVIEGELNAFMTHGHLYSVNTSRESLSAAARAAGCVIALYGHTHIRRVEEIDGVLCINPGSIAQSRSEERETYAVLSDKELLFYDQNHRIFAKERLNV
ncbi:metallophosphoesterase [Macrococcus hajekii]|uniref:Phosphoesterase n=1 Tax=Macrococcus hajekii TaxID=198482 RepID=A0A4R6BLU8_9STAP|nr:metallophosphoesterase [Macrococcus hajekii]TDM02780.1 metallophosphoesterase [Macrococcus hajekii]GGB03835.1 phosphoesterase [Macrococcus hajekii]